MNNKLKLLSEEEEALWAPLRIALAEERYRRMVAERALSLATVDQMTIDRAAKQIDAELEKL